MSSEPALHQDWLDFIQLFVANEVEFIIVGAFALALHDLPRTTGDIDFFVAATPENARRIAKAIHEFGFGQIEVNEQDFCHLNRFVTLGHPPVRIDILTSIEGVKFSDAWVKRNHGMLGPYQVAFLSEEHLLRNKYATGRLKDRADARRIEKKINKVPRQH
jgi:hypothetical protein